MLNVTECVRRLQDLFGDTAKNLAASTNFIQRERKITALGWILATVLGWMHNKNGTLETIVANFEQQGIEITEQAVSKRFTDCVGLVWKKKQRKKRRKRKGETLAQVRQLAVLGSCFSGLSGIAKRSLVSLVE